MRQEARDRLLMRWVKVAEAGGVGGGGGRCVTRVAVVGCSDLIQLSHHVIYYRTAVTLVAE